MKSEEFPMDEKSIPKQDDQTGRGGSEYPLPDNEVLLAMDGQENYQDLKSRTQKFALRIIRMARALPNDPAAGVIQKQIIRSGTSVGANYRAACRAKSAADFIHKMKIVEEETDETMYWMELILEENLLRPNQLNSLYEEANEILSMTVKSIFTARKGT